MAYIGKLCAMPVNFLPEIPGTLDKNISGVFDGGRK
jgi:hypothetical protein